jgi:tetratricopeptide (TPR) repeat protein
MQIELNELRSHVTRSRRALVAGVILLTIALAGVVWGISQLGGDVEQVDDRLTDVADGMDQTSEDLAKVSEQVKDLHGKTDEQLQKLYENPGQLAERMRQNISASADERLQSARDRKAKWDEIREIERRRDLTLDRVDDLILTMQQGLQREPDKVFREASRIVGDESVEAAIAYLSSHEEDILSRVDELAAREDEARQEKRKAQESLLLSADLLKQNLQFAEAQQLYEKVLNKSHQWSRAQLKLGGLLKDLAEFNLAEPHLRAAVALAENNEQQVAASSGLAGLLQLTERLPEAERLYRRALTVGEQCHGAEHPIVARILSNLAMLLQRTGRSTEAELLMRRAVAWRSRSSRTEPNIPR